MSTTEITGIRRVVNSAEKTLTYFIYKEIGSEYGLSGQAIANDIDAARFYLPGCERVAVRINSPGGNLIDGLSVYNAIKNSAIPVDTYVDGVAASIAGVIAMAGVRRYMNDFAKIMIHDPAFDSAELTEKDRETLDQLKGVLVSLFDNNSQMTPDEISELMTAETWFDAERALNAGLIDEIIKTDRKPTGGVANIISVYNLANEINTDKPVKKMTKIKQVLNLDETANDEQVETAVVSLKDTADQSAAKVADLEAEKQTLEAENAALAEQVEALTETAAAAVVDEAVNAGKFDVKDRDALIATAKNGLEAFKATAAAVKPGLPGRVMNRIVADVTNVTDKFNETDGTFDGKKLRDLEKAAPKVVADLVKNHSDVYEKMYFAQYGKPLNAAK